MRHHRTQALALALLLAACSGPVEESPQTASLEPAALVGSWRAVLTSPGGELPFELEVSEGTEGELQAVIGNGEEEAPISSAEIDGTEVVFRFETYDAEIRATANGEHLEGRWRKTIPEGDSTLPFTATRDAAAERFLPIGETPLEGGDGEAVASVEGRWAVEFTDEDGSEVAQGEFRQEGAEVEGTFLTPTGDYRFLEGRYEDGLLRLSTFDGAHAFLFHARAREDGTLEGDFYSRDTYHATWIARPLATGDPDVLPDGWEQVGLTNDEGRFSFAFPDLEGETVSLDDPRFEGKVVLVNVFGTWCPNCNDEAPLLARWHREYRERGLEVVGLAYEFTGDPERDRRQLRRFAERYGIEYPLLLAGTSDKKKAGETLPDLTAVLSYPTSIFIGRDGRVRKIHSGFAGPGTGEHYQRLVAETEATIEELLDEPI